MEATRRERLQNPRSEAERCVVHLMRLGAIGPTSAWLLVKEFFGWRAFGNRLVALARKLLIALWRYLEDSVMPQGVRLIASEI